MWHGMFIHYLFLRFNTFIIASSPNIDLITFYGFIFTVNETLRDFQALKLFLLLLFLELMEIFVSVKTKKEPKLSGAVQFG